MELLLLSGAWENLTTSFAFNMSGESDDLIWSLSKLAGIALFASLAGDFPLAFFPSSLIFLTFVF